MIKVVRTHQILIAAPVHSAFEYVSDIRRHPEWSSGRLSIEEVTPGPIAVGKEYVTRGEVLVQKGRRNTVRVTEYDPPHRFGFSAADPNFGEVSHVFTCAARGTKVLVTRTMTLSLNPVVALAFRLILYPLVGRPAMDRSLALLKDRLEKDLPA